MKIALEIAEQAGQHTQHRQVARSPEPALHPILRVQQQAGNRAVQQLLRQRLPQAKLAVSNPNDPAEQEADRVADHVMREKAGFPVSAPCSCEEGGEQCESCRQKAVSIQRRACSDAAPCGTQSSGESVNRVLATPGQPLAESARGALEPRFGHDFSGVRVHNDSAAAQSAQAMDALAYTVGDHIVFGAGQYAPGTNAGDRLLAHELTHTIQQTGGRAGMQGKIQRMHLAGGRKVFDCADYAGDKKLEACLNDEDRLSPGEHSATVTKVQNGLLRDGADLGPEGADGKYGAATGQAVQAFKRKYRLGFELYPDVGPGTMTKLDELCPAAPKPVPPPVNPPAHESCFDRIDWSAFFQSQDSDCRVTQSSIDAVCALAPNSPFNLGPDPCPKEPFESRVEDCVTFAGFSKLFEECGLPTSGQQGKADIVRKYKDWLKTKP